VTNGPHHHTARRALLTERAINEVHSPARQIALQTLANIWRDETTRTLLIDRIAKDQDDVLRNIARQMLAQNWPNDKP
jgi:hypothetical protein